MKKISIKTKLYAFLLVFLNSFIFPCVTAFAFTPPADDRGAVVQGGGNSSDATALITSIISQLKPILNPIIAFLMWGIATALIIGIVISLLQSLYATHKSGGKAGVTRFMTVTFQSLNIFMVLSIIALFFTYFMKFYFDNSVQQQLAGNTALFTPDSGTTSLDGVFKSVMSVGNSILQPILAWVSIGFLMAAAILILVTTLQGMWQTHNGAASALRMAIGKIGTYVVLLIAAFMIGTIVAVVMSLGSF